MTEQTDMTAAERRANTYNYRTPAELAEQARALIQGGPRTRTQLTHMLGTNSRRIDVVLHTLKQKGLVETFKARSARGQMDDYWFLTGQRPDSVVFKAAEILDGFRRAAFGTPGLS
jgi:hypothetical protein